MVHVGLQHGNGLQILHAIFLLPQQLVVLLEFAILGNNLNEVARLAGFDHNQFFHQIDPVRGIQDNGRALHRSNRHGRRIAHSVALHLLTKRFPVQFGCEISKNIDTRSPAFPGEHALAVVRVLAFFAGTFFLGQLHAHLGEVKSLVFHPALHFRQRPCFAVFEFSLGVPIRQIGDADAQGFKFFVVQATLRRQKILVLQQIVQGAVQNACGTTHFFGLPEFTPVQRRQCAQRNTAILVFHSLKRTRGQHDFRAQIGLIDGVNLGIEGPLILNIINVQQVDASRLATLRQNFLEDLLGGVLLLAQVRTFFVLNVQLLELGDVRVIRFVQIRNLVGIEKGDHPFLGQPPPEQRGYHHAIIHLPHARFVGSLVVLEYDKVVELVMPNGHVDRCGRIADSTLRARTQITKPFLEKRHDARVHHFPVANRRTQRPHPSHFQADSRTLSRVVRHHLARSKDGLQRVIGTQQHTR